MDNLEVVLKLILVIGLALIQGLLVSFCLLLLAKWNFLEWYDIHRKKWMPLRCEFCLSFWLGLGIWCGAYCALDYPLFTIIAVPLSVVVNFLVIKNQ